MDQSSSEFLVDPNENSNGLSALQSLDSIQHDKDVRVPYYCEENVWRLAHRKMKERPHDDYFVCFITNANKTVLMCHQRATKPNSPVVWDYHVILLAWQKQSREVVVYDVDSRLAYPIELTEYISKSFPVQSLYPPDYHPCFRLLPAQLYLQFFSSNRMHMYNAQKRCWNAPLPPYDCIKASGTVNAGSNMNTFHGAGITLEQYLDLTTSISTSTTNNLPGDAYGQILSLQELEAFDFEVAVHRTSWEPSWHWCSIFANCTLL